MTFIIPDSMVVFSTTDGGATWDTSAVDEDDPLSPLWSLCDIQFIDHIRGVIVGYGRNIVYYTENGAAHWNRVCWDGDELVRTINRVFTVNIDTTYFSEEGTNNLYRTFDKFETIDTLVSPLFIEDMHFFSGLNGIIVGRGGVYETSDGGETWSFSEGTEDLRLSDVDFSSPTYGVAVGWGNTIALYYREEGIALSQPHPRMLLKAYPNPFNSLVSIRMDIPLPCNVRVGIYNTKGDKVKNLFAGKVKSGILSLEWNGMDEMGREMPSGIYLCRVISGNRSKTAKIVLVK